MSDLTRCVTADCDNEATRKVSWTWPEDGGGVYCDACALSLWEGGDVVDPPFDLTDTVQERPWQTEPKWSITWLTVNNEPFPEYVEITLPNGRKRRYWSRGGTP